MGEDRYLAHVAEDGREQSLLEHLEGTAQLCAQFAAWFGAGEQGRLAGMAHDLGKYSQAFQKRVRGSAIRVDHATAGAFECARAGQPLAAFAVAGHHGGLPDGSAAGKQAGSSFDERLKKKLEDYSGWTQEVTLPWQAPVPEYLDKTGREYVFFTRMLYSCLVDADYLDTEAFMKGEPRQRGEQATMAQLWERLQGHIAHWFPPEGELNRQRCAVLERCMERGEGERPGLFTLTVPTGGGKTVASLAFALAHAKANGLRRVIYVVPYTSIIEQTAQVFRSILGEDQVLEHHSNVLFDMELDQESNPGTLRMAQATENWDMPVVVTTAVQFFESLYASRSAQCRKLHNIAGSVVVFDEAQMLPLYALRPCVHAIAQLVKHYGVSGVLCTATQPALRPLFEEFLPGVQARELCPDEVLRSPVFRRVTFRSGVTYTWAELADVLNGVHQGLCIVNTRRSAQTLYQTLRGEGAFHLSTLMCPSHRRAQLEEIRRRLDEGLPCRVVSTSLIEAGVDVDFPGVWREEWGLDSILQAAGRCNREGKRPAEESVVTVFRGESKIAQGMELYRDVCVQILREMSDFASQDGIRRYFTQVMECLGAENLDKGGVLKMVDHDMMPFRRVDGQFHMIDENQQCTIYIPRGAGAALVNRLRSGERSRGLFRRLGAYGVSVRQKWAGEMEKRGDVECLEDGVRVLTNLRCYDEEVGLRLEDAWEALLF